jgi:TonB family protein
MTCSSRIERQRLFLFLGSLTWAITAIAQDIVTPRPRPEPTAEQREIQSLVRPRIHCVAVYPEDAAAAKQEGWVRLELTISSEGEPLTPRIVDSSPPDIFDAAALEAASKCRFEPQITDGEAVPLEGVLFDAVFRLE